MKRTLFNKKWTFVPLAGIALFVVLYIVAANYYPGGSNVYPTAKGFDWVNNYWGDLLAKNAKNGIHNSGRDVAGWN